MTNLLECKVSDATVFSAGVVKIGLNFPRRVHPVPDERIMRIARLSCADRWPLWLTSHCQRHAAMRQG
jgi:hypothetical protein